MYKYTLYYKEMLLSFFIIHILNVNSDLIFSWISGYKNNIYNFIIKFLWFIKKLILK